MAEGDGVALEEQRGEGAVDQVHVGQAHAGRLDLDQHLPRAGLRAGHSSSRRVRLGTCRRAASICAMTGPPRCGDPGRLPQRSIAGRLALTVHPTAGRLALRWSDELTGTGRPAPAPPRGADAAGRAGRRGGPAGERGPGGRDGRRRGPRGRVHETSVYRRWGTRENLILDALTTELDAALPVPGHRAGPGRPAGVLLRAGLLLDTAQGRALLRLSVERDDTWRTGAAPTGASGWTVPW